MSSGKSRLRDLLLQKDNRICADCSAPDPKWASANIGVFLCLKCFDVHRSLGPHVSKVLSVTLDEWSDEDIDSMIEVGGNASANAVYEAYIPEGISKPRPDASHDDRLKYIRSKYELQEFLKPSLRITPLPFDKGSLEASFSKKLMNNIQGSSNKTESSEGMVEFIGSLKITVVKGSNLAVRDRRSSDPYVRLSLGKQRTWPKGLMKIDGTGRIVHFAEKPKGSDLKAMEVDTTLLGLSDQEALSNPYIASMGVYLFRSDVLMELLHNKYPERNDFGSEIIPSAVAEYNVQAYLFNGYWEDIGTVKSFFDANLALTEEFPKFEFYDPKTPFCTSARFLPPTKVEKCEIVDSIVSHGCFIHGCKITRSIVGIRSRLERGVVLENTMMMGADDYQTEYEIEKLLRMGKVPIGVGENTKIRNCIIDKNAKIGKNVIIANNDGVEEGDRPEEGFYIRSGITVIPKNATIKDGVVI